MVSFFNGIQIAASISDLINYACEFRMFPCKSLMGDFNVKHYMCNK